MTIAELFVNLGIKGSEKTVGALNNVKKGLSETASMSLEAKAGLVAAMYALEKLFAASGATGTGLTNFNALTGMSVQQLQRWQYAARQAGVATEDMTGSMKAVQSTMTNMLLGKGAPEGLAMVANKVGFDPKRARDTIYVLQQLQKYAQAVPKDVGNVALKSFGLSEGVIAAMRRNAFTPGMLAKAPTYSDKEVSQLDKANVAWSNLGHEIEMAIGHFNAKHGSQLVNDIAKLVPKVLELAEAFSKLADKLKVFQLIGKAFEGWGMIFDKLNGGVDAVSGAVNDPKKAKELRKDVKQFFKEMPGVFSEMGKDIFTPSAPAAAASMAGKPAQNVEINQTLQFQHDGQNHQKNTESHKKAIKDAYRQLQSQVQGS